MKTACKNPNKPVEDIDLIVTDLAEFLKKFFSNPKKQIDSILNVMMESHSANKSDSDQLALGIQFQTINISENQGSLVQV